MATRGILKRERNSYHRRDCACDECCWPQGAEQCRHCGEVILDVGPHEAADCSPALDFSDMEESF
jgi:hypothetical protein